MLSINKKRLSHTDIMSLKKAKLKDKEIFNQYIFKQEDKLTKITGD